MMFLETEIKLMHHGEVVVPFVYIDFGAGFSLCADIPDCFECKKGLYLGYISTSLFKN